VRKKGKGKTKCYQPQKEFRSISNENHLGRGKDIIRKDLVEKRTTGQALGHWANQDRRRRHTQR